MRRAVKVVLVLDGAVALLFGLSSALRPVEIYGTLVNLEPLALHQGTVAALTSLSVFYVLFGALALVAVQATGTTQLALVGILAARHLLSGGKGVMEAGASWQVGNPLPDLVIHALFVVSYAVVVVALRRELRATT